MRFTTGRLPLEHPATPPLVVTNQHDAVPDYAQSSSTDQRKCFTPLLLEDALRYANFLRLASFGVLVLGPEQTNKRSSFLSISQSVSQSASQSPGGFPPPGHDHIKWALAFLSPVGHPYSPLFFLSFSLFPSSLLLSSPFYPEVPPKSLPSQEIKRGHRAPSFKSALSTTASLVQRAFLGLCNIFTFLSTMRGAILATAAALAGTAMADVAHMRRHGHDSFHQRRSPLAEADATCGCTTEVVTVWGPPTRKSPAVATESDRAGV